MNYFFDIYIIDNEMFKFYLKSYI